MFDRSCSKHCSSLTVRLSALCSPFGFLQGLCSYDILHAGLQVTSQMKTFQLCFLWHMHQPYYSDRVGRSTSMPWVRLHAIKAYYDMAYLLDQFPQVQATFNFTPSLLLQLQESASGTTRDLFYEHAARPAEDLTLPERAFIVRHFFSANWATMVRPFPRYHELLVKRGTDVRGVNLERVARQFSTQELLDLQVWHNLAWFGYGMAHRHPHLAELRRKNRHFTEQDKQDVLQLEQIAMQEIVPLYRRLADRQQIELSTSSFYHPILPLIMDTDCARRARPDLPLPSRFRAAEDAQAQIDRAMALHTASFGRSPVGLWPSEGSVCPELFPLLHRSGLRWCATDEGILQRSLEMMRQTRNRPASLYQPYHVGSPGEEVAIFFRDRELSDAFGFVYHKTAPDSAADDMVKRLSTLAESIPGDRAVISIILDGENPWEHYHDGGERLLSLLYRTFDRKGLVVHNRKRMETATMSRALAACPPAHRLDRLHSGSWINQDFKIWIGHAEDNHAWELLHETRKRLVERSRTLPTEQAQAAWEELYAAEGSDWFWWYGDDFDTDYKQEFDRVFRAHLRNACLRAGLPPWDALNQSLILHEDSRGLDQVHGPIARLTPTIDGLETDFFEWRGAGTVDPHPPLGAMWKSEGFFTALYFGVGAEQLFLRFDPGEELLKRRDQVMIEVELASDHQLHKVAVVMSAPGPEQFTLLRATPEHTFLEIGFYRSICYRKILEVAVPLRAFQAENSRDVRMTIMFIERGLEVARYPHHSPAVVPVPSAEFDAAMWRV